MNTLQLQEFFVEGGDHKTSHALLHIAEPSTPEEKKKGYFFAVCEINQGEDRDIVALQNLIDEIENRYYEIPEETETNSLEEVLKKINHESYLLSSKNLDLHCAIGVLRQEEVYFSCHGNPLMFLFYRNKSGIYQKMNLVENTEENNESNQLFHQIVQGKISPNDFLFIATPHVVDYFNPDRLEKIVSTRPVRQSAEHLERVLSELKNKLSFGGLIIHLHQDANEVAKIKKPSPVIKGSSERSLHSLFATEQKTASTLSSALIPNLGNKFKNFIGQEKNTVNTLTETATTEDVTPSSHTEISSNHARQHRPNPIQSIKIPENEWLKNTKVVLIIIFSIAKKIVLSIWWILALIINILYSCIRFLGLLFLVITNIKNRRVNILENWKRQIGNLKNNIKQLPLLTQILLILTIILIAAFIFSTIAIKSNRNKAAEEKQFNDTIQLITTAKDAAESALIYKNESSALVELQKAKEYLTNLNCRNKKNVCEELNNQLENLLVKIRKVSVVSPEILVDWSDYQNKLEKIIKIKNKLITLSPDNGEILIYNLLTKEKSLIKLGGKLQSIAVPKENDYALVSTQENSFWRFNPDDNTIKKIDITFPQNKLIVQSMVIYNRRLYTLDTSNGQIYKHENNRDGFSLGKEWSKDNADNIKDGFDLAIDGDIFIARQNGQIDKFTKGELQTFAVSGLDPILKNSAEIWTYNDIDIIYLLDNTEKRLIVLNKEGQLQTQITASAWQSPSGFTLGENAKQIYILDKNKVYSLLLP